MKQFFGSSQRGSLQEATQGLRDPQLIMLMSNPRQFEQHVQELERLFPQVPSIGCIGMSYSTQVIESGVGVVAYSGVTAAANVLEQVSVMPVKYIQRLQQDVKKVSASGQNTICIDFCSGNDACRWWGEPGTAAGYPPTAEYTRMPRSTRWSKTTRAG